MMNVEYSISNNDDRSILAPSRSLSLRWAEPVEVSKCGEGWGGTSVSDAGFVALNESSENLKMKF